MGNLWWSIFFMWNDWSWIRCFNAQDWNWNGQRQNFWCWWSWREYWHDVFFWAVTEGNLIMKKIIHDWQRVKLTVRLQLPAMLEVARIHYVVRRNLHVELRNLRVELHTRHGRFQSHQIERNCRFVLQNPTSECPMLEELVRHVALCSAQR